MVEVAGPHCDLDCKIDAAGDGRGRNCAYSFTAESISESRSGSGGTHHVKEGSPVYHRCCHGACDGCCSGHAGVGVVAGYACQEGGMGGRFDVSGVDKACWGDARGSSVAAASVMMRLAFPTSQG